MRLIHNFFPKREKKTNNHNIQLHTNDFIQVKIPITVFEKPGLNILDMRGRDRNLLCDQTLI